MPKTTTKTRGHRFERVRFHIPYYTKDFFDPKRDLNDGEEKETKAKTVKIPVKIDADGDESRANVTTWEMRGISHFDNNVETFYSRSTSCMRG